MKIAEIVEEDRVAQENGGMTTQRKISVKIVLFTLVILAISAILKLI